MFPNTMQHIMHIQKNQQKYLAQFGKKNFALWDPCPLLGLFIFGSPLPDVLPSWLEAKTILVE